MDALSNPVGWSPARPAHLARPPIPGIVMQHVEEAAHLWRIRSLHVRAPRLGLRQLGRLDERIAAHLDGVAVAGDCGRRLAHEALERPGSGEVFVATVGAIADGNQAGLDKLLAVTEALPASRAGLLSAFGWVSATQLQGITKRLFQAASPWHREVGLAACAMHGVDPGLVLGSAMRHPDAGLRASALRVAGQCGRIDVVDSCIAALSDEDPRCAFEAARASLLLGDRGESLIALQAIAVDAEADTRRRSAALRVLLKVESARHSRSILAVLAKDLAQPRTLLRAMAVAGDPHYVPWLIAQMPDPKLARLAGEAFSAITGLDMKSLRLEEASPPSIASGPNDDPADDNVAMDEDDGLPWPDAAKLADWWHANGARFAPGQRHFMGELPTPAHCLAVLKTGFQRQRIAAAQYLSLFAPGTPLFNTRAPTRRQQRLLATMAG